MWRGGDPRFYFAAIQINDWSPYKQLFWLTESLYNSRTSPTCGFMTSQFLASWNATVIGHECLNHKGAGWMGLIFKKNKILNLICMNMAEKIMARPHSMPLLMLVLFLFHWVCFPSYIVLKEFHRTRMSTIVNAEFKFHQPLPKFSHKK